MNHHGLHHLVKRRREGQCESGYDKFMLVVGTLAPFTLLPQILTIWRDRQVAGVSVATWLLLTLASIFWLIYGVRHKSKALIVTNTLYVVLNMAIVTGVWAQ